MSREKKKQNALFVKRFLQCAMSHVLLLINYLFLLIILFFYKHVLTFNMKQIL
jgi:lipopolysaccharide/colanic/teichoic acid biosynthesis glycosyltransferase